MRARSTLLRPVIPWHYEEIAIREKLIKEIAGMEVAAKAGLGRTAVLSGLPRR